MTTFPAARHVSLRRMAARLAFAAAVTLSALPAAAQAPKGAAGGDPVVARVNGTPIRQSDVQGTIASLPAQYANVPKESLRKAVLQQLIDRQLVAAAGHADKLDKTEDFKRQMADVRERLLEQAYYRKVVAEKVTDRALRRMYEQTVASKRGTKQVRARHILVKTRAEAIKIINELGRGKDFATLAREHSIGPSKAQGGELGYFTRDQMVAPFAKAAFSMKKGEVSSEPVKTKFGWHIIKVEDIRTVAPPPFEKAKAGLKRKLTNKVIDEEVKRLRDGAKIEILDPAAKASPSGK